MSGDLSEGGDLRSEIEENRQYLIRALRAVEATTVECRKEAWNATAKASRLEEALAAQSETIRDLREQIFSSQKQLKESLPASSTEEVGLLAESVRQLESEMTQSAKTTTSKIRALQQGQKDASSETAARFQRSESSLDRMLQAFEAQEQRFEELMHSSQVRIDAQITNSDSLTALRLDDLEQRFRKQIGLLQGSDKNVHGKQEPEDSAAVTRIIERLDQNEKRLNLCLLKVGQNEQDVGRIKTERKLDRDNTAGIRDFELQRIRKQDENIERMEQNMEELGQGLAKVRAKVVSLQELGEQMQRSQQAVSHEQALLASRLGDAQAQVAEEKQRSDALKSVVSSLEWKAEEMSAGLDGLGSWMKGSLQAAEDSDVSDPTANSFPEISALKHAIHELQRDSERMKADYQSMLQTVNGICDDMLKLAPREELGRVTEALADQHSSLQVSVEQVQAAVSDSSPFVTKTSVKTLAAQTSAQTRDLIDHLQTQLDQVRSAQTLIESDVLELRTRRPVSEQGGQDSPPTTQEGVQQLSARLDALEEVVRATRADVAGGEARTSSGAGAGKSASEWALEEVRRGLRELGRQVEECSGRQAAAEERLQSWPPAAVEDRVSEAPGARLEVERLAERLARVEEGLRATRADVAGAEMRSTSGAGASARASERALEEVQRGLREVEQQVQECGGRQAAVEQQLRASQLEPPSTAPSPSAVKQVERLADRLELVEEGLRATRADVAGAVMRGSSGAASEWALEELQSGLREMGRKVEECSSRQEAMEAQARLGEEAASRASEGANSAGASKPASDWMMEEMRRGVRELGRTVQEQEEKQQRVEEEVRELRSRMSLSSDVAQLLDGLEEQRKPVRLTLDRNFEAWNQDQEEQLKATICDVTAFLAPWQVNIVKLSRGSVMVDLLIRSDRWKEAVSALAQDLGRADSKLRAREGATDIRTPESGDRSHLSALSAGADAQEEGRRVQEQVEEQGEKLEVLARLVESMTDGVQMGLDRQDTVEDVAGRVEVLEASIKSALADVQGVKAAQTALTESQLAPAPTGTSHGGLGTSEVEQQAIRELAGKMEGMEWELRAMRADVGSVGEWKASVEAVKVNATESSKIVGDLEQKLNRLGSLETVLLPALYKKIEAIEKEKASNLDRGFVDLMQKEVSELAGQVHGVDVELETVLKSVSDQSKEPGLKGDLAKDEAYEATMKSLERLEQSVGNLEEKMLELDDKTHDQRAAVQQALVDFAGRMEAYEKGLATPRDAGSEAHSGADWVTEELQRGVRELGRRMHELATRQDLMGEELHGVRADLDKGGGELLATKLQLEASMSDVEHRLQPLIDESKQRSMTAADDTEAEKQLVRELAGKIEGMEWELRAMRAEVGNVATQAPQAPVPSRTSSSGVEVHHVLNNLSIKFEELSSKQEDLETAVRVVANSGGGQWEDENQVWLLELSQRIQALELGGKAKTIPDERAGAARAVLNLKDSDVGAREELIVEIRRLAKELTEKILVVECELLNVKNELNETHDRSIREGADTERTLGTPAQSTTDGTVLERVEALEIKFRQVQLDQNVRNAAESPREAFERVAASRLEALEAEVEAFGNTRAAIDILDSKLDALNSAGEKAANAEQLEGLAETVNDSSAKIKEIQDQLETLSAASAKTDLLEGELESLKTNADIEGVKTLHVQLKECAQQIRTHEDRFALLNALSLSQASLEKAVEELKISAQAVEIQREESGSSEPLEADPWEYASKIDRIEKQLKTLSPLKSDEGSGLVEDLKSVEDRLRALEQHRAEIDVQLASLGNGSGVDARADGVADFGAHPGEANQASLALGSGETAHVITSEIGFMRPEMLALGDNPARTLFDGEGTGGGEEHENGSTASEGPEDDDDIPQIDAASLQALLSSPATFLQATIPDSGGDSTFASATDDLLESGDGEAAAQLGASQHQLASRQEESRPGFDPSPAKTLGLPSISWSHRTGRSLQSQGLQSVAEWPMHEDEEKDQMLKTLELLQENLVTRMAKLKTRAAQEEALAAAVVVDEASHGHLAQVSRDMQDLSRSLAGDTLAESSMLARSGHGELSMYTRSTGETLTESILTQSLHGTSLPAASLTETLLTEYAPPSLAATGQAELSWEVNQLMPSEVAVDERGVDIPSGVEDDTESAPAEQKLETSEETVEILKSLETVQSLLAKKAQLLAGNDDGSSDGDTEDDELRMEIQRLVFELTGKVQAVEGELKSVRGSVPQGQKDGDDGLPALITRDTLLKKVQDHEERLLLLKTLESAQALLENKLDSLELAHAGAHSVMAGDGGGISEIQGQLQELLGKVEAQGRKQVSVEGELATLREMQSSFQVSPFHTNASGVEGTMSAQRGTGAAGTPGFMESFISHVTPDRNRPGTFMDSALTAEIPVARLQERVLMLERAFHDRDQPEKRSADGEDEDDEDGGVEGRLSRVEQALIEVLENRGLGSGGDDGTDLSKRLEDAEQSLAHMRAKQVQLEQSLTGVLPESDGKLEESLQGGGQKHQSPAGTPRTPKTPRSMEKLLREKLGAIKSLEQSQKELLKKVDTLDKKLALSGPIFGRLGVEQPTTAAARDDFHDQGSLKASSQSESVMEQAGGSGGIGRRVEEQGLRQMVIEEEVRALRVDVEEMAVSLRSDPRLAVPCVPLSEYQQQLQETRMVLRAMSSVHKKGGSGPADAANLDQVRECLESCVSQLLNLSQYIASQDGANELHQEDLERWKENLQKVCLAECRSQLSELSDAVSRLWTVVSPRPFTNDEGSVPGPFATESALHLMEQGLLSTIDSLQGSLTQLQQEVQQLPVQPTTTAVEVTEQGTNAAIEPEKLEDRVDAAQPEGDSTAAHLQEGAAAPTRPESGLGLPHGESLTTLSGSVHDGPGVSEEMCAEICEMRFNELSKPLLAGLDDRIDGACRAAQETAADSEELKQQVETLTRDLKVMKKQLRVTLEGVSIPSRSEPDQLSDPDQPPTVEAVPAEAAEARSDADQQEAGASRAGSAPTGAVSQEVRETLSGPMGRTHQEEGVSEASPSADDLQEINQKLKRLEVSVDMLSDKFCVQEVAVEQLQRDSEELSTESAIMREFQATMKHLHQQGDQLEVKLKEIADRERDVKDLKEAVAKVEDLEAIVKSPPKPNNTADPLLGRIAKHEEELSKISELEQRLGTVESRVTQLDEHRVAADSASLTQRVAHLEEDFTQVITERGDDASVSALQDKVRVVEEDIRKVGDATRELEQALRNIATDEVWRAGVTGQLEETTKRLEETLPGLARRIDEAVEDAAAKQATAAAQAQQLVAVEQELQQAVERFGPVEKRMADLDSCVQSLAEQTAGLEGKFEAAQAAAAQVDEGVQTGEEDAAVRLTQLEGRLDQQHELLRQMETMGDDLLRRETNAEKRIADLEEAARQTAETSSAAIARKADQDQLDKLEARKADQEKVAELESIKADLDKVLELEVSKADHDRVLELEALKADKETVAEIEAVVAQHSTKLEEFQEDFDKADESQLEERLAKLERSTLGERGKQPRIGVLESKLAELDEAMEVRENENADMDGRVKDLELQEALTKKRLQRLDELEGRCDALGDELSTLRLHVDDNFVRKPELRPIERQVALLTAHDRVMQQASALSPVGMAEVTPARDARPAAEGSGGAGQSPADDGAWGADLEHELSIASEGSARIRALAARVRGVTQARTGMPAIPQDGRFDESSQSPPSPDVSPRSRLEDTAEKIRMWEVRNQEGPQAEDGVHHHDPLTFV